MGRSLAAPFLVIATIPGTGLAYSVEEKLSMPIDKELLAILACPKCKGDIRLAKDGNGLVCEACRLLYEIRDNIPVMLIDEAVRLDDPTGV
jgi:uncharacterized protein